MEEKEINKYQQQPVSLVLVPQHVVEDEISLMDLWGVIVRRKVLVLGVALVCLALSLVYAILASPVYKATAHLLPPMLSQLDGLESHKVTSDSAYKIFVQNVRSRALRRVYFDKNKLLDKLVFHGHVNPNDVFEAFNRSFVVSGGKGALTVSFEGEDPSLAAQWVNGLVNMANRRSAQMLVADANASLKNKMQGVLDKISALRESFHQRQEDKEVRLKEGINLAEALGIKDFTTRSDNNSASNSGEGLPLYMMGYKALKAELKLLRQRKNDDAYIPGLRDLQEKLLLLKSIRFDPTLISSVRIDQPAQVPDHHIKPKRRLIIALGVFGGIVAGMFAAFLVDSVARARRQQENGTV